MKLNGLILEWAKERDLLHAENADVQLLQVLEEVGELAKAIKKQDSENIREEIGDVYVSTIINAAQLGYEIKPTNGTPYLYASIGMDLAEITKDVSIRQFSFAISRLRAFAAKMGYNLDDCVLAAYEKISKRKGRTINGSFVKEQ